MTLLTHDMPAIGGRYQILRYVGAGGMQHVYEALDTLFQRTVALKAPKDDAGLRRFQNSAVVSARVNHVNVAKTLDYVDEDRGSFLIEEFVSGADLGAIFPKPVPLMPPSACARILHQLSKGLAASHQAGVVHRDLKPSNIMVVDGPRLSIAKITDFGIAKMAEAEIGEWAAEGKGSTSSKTVLGAIPYMAPESISDFKKASYASDVWAIAAITYELLSGRKPFGTGLLSIPSILKADPPASPATIAPPQFRTLGQELLNIILSCLQKDEGKRPSAATLARELENLCYAVDDFETGIIKKRLNSYVGFISADLGSDVMYNVNSFYGSSVISEGDRVWFARHPGTGNDRAFPLVKLPLVNA